MIVRWPQHHALAVAVAALILAPRWPPGLPLLAAVAWVSQPRRGWAIAAVVVTVGAGIGGSWRLAEARSAARAPLAAGAAVRPDEPVEVLEQPEQSLGGSWRTTVRLRGTTVELRTPVSGAAPALEVGGRVRVAGRLRPLSERSVGARTRGIALTLDAKLVGVAGRRGGWRGAIDRIRERAERTLTDADETDGGPRTALLRGMVLGQDAGFGDEQEDAYRRSGLSHLVAASGQNVALLAAMVIGVGMLVGIGRRWRIGWALLAIVAYVPLAGGGPSIRRAGVMGVLTLLALVLGRPADRWWALLCAAAVTVLVDPFSPGQLGWQLSFAAVVGLLVLVEPLAAAARRAGLPEWVGRAVAVPLGAGLATAPVLAAGVGDVSLTSLPANLVVEPVVAPVTWFGMVAGVLGPEATPVSGALVALTGPLLDWINGVAVRAASPGWAVVRPGPVRALLPVVLLGVTLTVVARPAWMVRAGDRLRRRRWFRRLRRELGRFGGGRGRRGRTAIVAGLACAVVVAVVIGGARDGTGGGASGDAVVVLDVGQGSATLLRQGDATILVDAGPAGGRVLDRLAEQGVRRLDVLVLSHAAEDHTGGAPAVARRLRPALLVDGSDGHADPAAAVAAELVRRGGGRVVAARAGQRLRVRGLTAEVRWPPARDRPVAAGKIRTNGRRSSGPSSAGSGCSCRATARAARCGWPPGARSTCWCCPTTEAPIRMCPACSPRSGRGPSSRRSGPTTATGTQRRRRWRRCGRPGCRSGGPIATAA